jgi:hypothetical protein
MGNVIRPTGSVDDILRDVARTLANAAAKGAPFSDDAERFLGASHALAQELALQRRATVAAHAAARGRQLAEDHRCNDLVGRLKDELFNRIGRPGNDPIFAHLFPGGLRTYTRATRANKPVALESLARMLETHRHPSIPAEEVARCTAELRAQAAAMEAVNAEARPAESAARLVSAQRTANARHARLQLQRLKKYWIAVGVTEQECHLIIPDRKPPGGGEAQPDRARVSRPLGGREGASHAESQQPGLPERDRDPARALTVLPLLACAPPPVTSTTSSTATPTGSSTSSTAPGWRAQGIAWGSRPDATILNASVATAGAEVWAVWEEGSEDRAVHELWLQRLGGVDEPVALGGRLDYGSFVPAIAADPAQAELVVQRLVDCEVGTWSACGEVPVEVELDWVDRATGEERIEPVVGVDGLEKGRGAAQLRADGLDLCFKAKHPDPLADEVHCRDAAGALDQPSGAADGSDDHPVVLRRADGARIVAFTSTRDGTRSTAITDGGAPALLDPVEVHAEDPALATSDGATVHAAWSEVGDPGRVVHARCGGPSCGSPDDWVQDEVASGARPESPGIAVWDGVPVVAYTLDDRVQVAIGCPDGWRAERPDALDRWGTTQHGQPPIAVTDDGRVEVVYALPEEDGTAAVWWAERTGPLCPAAGGA